WRLPADSPGQSRPALGSVSRSVVHPLPPRPMDLLARLRPRWRHPDPAVRLAAVRDMGPRDQERLGTIASGDPDLRVRRAAIERLEDPGILDRLAGSETDPAL